MRRYITGLPKKKYDAGVRIVHNFQPGPPDDPGRARGYGDGGFRYWITDEPIEDTAEVRCYCGWEAGTFGTVHYGTTSYIDSEGRQHDPWRWGLLDTMERMLKDGPDGPDYNPNVTAEEVADLRKNLEESGRLP